METNKKVKSRGNGEGTIYKSSATGLYVAQYFVNGKRKSIYQKKNEKITDFKKRFSTIIASINNNTFIEKTNDTLYIILKRYIDQKYKDGITKGRSHTREMQTLKALEKSCINFINKPIQEVTIEDIEDSKDEIKKYAKTVIDKLWSLLIKGFKIATVRKKIPFNIMEDDTLTKPLSVKSFNKTFPLTLSEEKKLNEILDGPERHHKYRNIVKLELITSMRIGEVLARSTHDINKNENSLYIHNTLTEDEYGNIVLGEHTKTYNKITDVDSGERYFPLDEELKEILKEETSKKISNIYNLLFWDYTNNSFISPKKVNSWLHRINQKYKITSSLHNHKLRHTRITRWKEAGMDLSAIQYLAGHVEGSSITNDVYINISKDYAFNQLIKTNNSIAL